MTTVHLYQLTLWRVRVPRTRAVAPPSPEPRSAIKLVRRQMASEPVMTAERPALSLPHLFSPFTLRGKIIKNRILSTGHDTTLPTDFVPNDALIAYQEARAAGGVGMIVIQVAGVHETARYTSHLLMATSDDCIQGYR